MQWARRLSSAQWMTLLSAVIGLAVTFGLKLTPQQEHLIMVIGGIIIAGILSEGYRAGKAAAVRQPPSGE